MTRILIFRCLCSVLLCLGMLVNSATTRAKARCGPTGIQVCMDVLCPFYYQYDNREGTQYEFNASVDFASFILEGDYGWGNIKWKGYNKAMSSKSAYASKGQYFRIGLDYNLLQDTPDKNMAFLGFRHARSFFKDSLVSEVSYDSTGPIKNGNNLINNKQDNVTARWFEAVAGVKVKVWKMLYVGGAIRYKFGLHFDEADSYVPYDVLGWGLSDGRPFGFNLYLSLRIPFVRDTFPKTPKKVASPLLQPS
jgi:Domain of unknown function (DUF6048)